MFCYNVISEGSNWDDANASCASMGMSLALRNILNDFSTVLNNRGGDFWIGLRRDDRNSLFIWNDGVMLNGLINLANSEGNANCGFITNGVLSNQQCSSSSNSYICQSQRANGTG